MLDSMFGQLYKLEVILANIAYFIIVSDCFFWLLESLSGQVRAGVFERAGSSGGGFNAVYAKFRRSVSQWSSSGGGRAGRFERLWTGFNLEYTERRHLWFYLSDPLTSYYCWWLSKITRPCRNYFLWMSKKNQSYSSN